MVWLDLAKTRRWPGWKAVLADRQKAAAAAMRRFAAVTGFDPGAHLDRIAGAAHFDSGQLRWFLLLQGKNLRARLSPLLPKLVSKSKKVRKTRYRGVEIDSVAKNGHSALGFLESDLVVSGAPLAVRRTVDLLRGRPEEAVLHDKRFRRLWGHLQGAPWPQRPTGVVLMQMDDRVQKWLKKKKQWAPLAALHSWGLRLQLGAWVQLVWIGLTPARKQAAALVRWTQALVNRFTAVTFVRRWGLDRYTRFLHAHHEGKVVYIQFCLPQALAVRLARVFLRLMADE